MPGLQLLAVFDPPSKGQAQHLDDRPNRRSRNASNTVQAKMSWARDGRASSRVWDISAKWKALSREMTEILTRPGTCLTTNYTYPSPGNCDAYVNLRDFADKLIEEQKSYLDENPGPNDTLFADLEHYVARAVPTDLLCSAIVDVIRLSGCYLLNIPISGVNGSEQFVSVRGLPWDDERSKAALQDLFQKLHFIPLRHAKSVVVMARVKGANLLLEDFVSHWYAQGYGKNSKDVSTDLEVAMCKSLVPFLNEVSRTVPFSEADSTSLPHMVDWQNTVKHQLSKLRLKNLYGLVCGSESLQDGPEARGILYDLKVGKLSDLKTHLQNRRAREDTHSHFLAMVNARHLQPGASTVQIIDIYMRIVAIFRAIDPDGTILPRLANRVRRFLKVRDDATEIILSSMLQGSTFIDSAAGHVGAESYRGRNQVKQSTEHFSQSVADCFDSQEHERYTHFYEGSDMNDMNWVPAPTDAGPGYQATRTQDAMAYLIKLVPTGQFIAVLQRMLSERFLLGGDGSSHDVAASHSGGNNSSIGPSSFYEKETRLLNMFKNRFTDGDIRKCEIMLRDVNESARLGRRMRRQAIEYETTRRCSPGQTQPPVFDDGGIGFQVMALSREYWPETLVDRHKMQTVGGDAQASVLKPEFDDEKSDPDPPAHDADDYDPETPDFTPPEPLRRAAASYTAAFQHFKPGRRLQWFEDLGVVTVELEFADGRCGVQRCSALQAAVVHAFGDDGNGGGTGKRKSVRELREVLGGRVSSRRVRECCGWWVGMGVLRETKSGVFQVVEDQQSGPQEPTPPTTFAATPSPAPTHKPTVTPSPHTPSPKTAPQSPPS